MLTLSTCFYIVKSKFNVDIYKNWINNFLLNVNKTNIVIYTNEESLYLVKQYAKPNIKIVIKNFDKFYNYKYKDYWIENNKKDTPLHYIDWKLQLIWAEKISFVKSSIESNFFNDKWHGWCDIGYFRNDPDEIKHWPNLEKVNSLDSSKIYYAQICEDNYLHKLIDIVNDQNHNQLPNKPIPVNQVSIAGGFFLIEKDNIDYWFNTFDRKLLTYFKNNYLVKDDQMVLINCILLNRDRFILIKKSSDVKSVDFWFLFKAFLRDNSTKINKVTQIIIGNNNMTSTKDRQREKDQENLKRDQENIRRKKEEEEMKKQRIAIKASRMDKIIKQKEEMARKKISQKIEDLPIEEELHNNENIIVKPIPDHERVTKKVTHNILMSSKISILIPIYNTKINYLEQCFNSISNQTFRGKIELVLINDGSNNKVKQYLKNLKMDNRFIVILKHNPTNYGIAKSLNIGLSLCSSELIARMDGDDVMLPDRLQEQWTFFKKNPKTDILGTGIQLFNDRNTINKVDNNFPSEINPHWVVNGHVDYFLPHPSVMYKRSVIQELEGYDESFIGCAEDYDLWIRALMCDRIIRVMKGVYVMYRCHFDQLSRKMTANSKVKRVENRNQLRKYLEERK